MNTVDDFAAGLRHRYEHAKLVKGHYLDEPTPRKLLDLCHDIASQDLTEEDRDAMAAFFGRSQSLLAAIENTKAVKMRNVLFFLQGRNQNTNRETLNLLAVMLDFKNRPLRKFLKEGYGSLPPGTGMPTVGKGVIPDDKGIEADGEIKEVRQPIGIEAGGEIKEVLQPIVKSTWKQRISGKKQLLVWALVLALWPGSITAWHYFKEPGCMAWSGDHYVSSPCDVPGAEDFDKNQFSLEEIEVHKGDVFFKEGKPVVWYCRRDGYHFFNKRGFDPVSGKPLMPITRQVILSRGLWE